MVHNKAEITTGRVYLSIKLFGWKSCFVDALAGLTLSAVSEQAYLVAAVWMRVLSRSSALVYLWSVKGSRTTAQQWFFSRLSLQG